MGDLEKALADIGAIRRQIAGDTAFRGCGPVTLAVTGGMALAMATGQALWLPDPGRAPHLFLLGWIVTAAVSALILWAEMQGRSRRRHGSMADEMIVNAVRLFLPAGAAGALLCLVLTQLAPDTLWLLPGLWQMLVGLGLFASLRSLPRGVVVAALWYGLAGVGVLAIAALTRSLSPWTMGLPFAVGQLLLAAAVWFDGEGADD